MEVAAHIPTQSGDRPGTFLTSTPSLVSIYLLDEASFRASISTLSSLPPHLHSHCEWHICPGGLEPLFLQLLNSSDLLFSPLLPPSTHSGHGPYQQLWLPFFWNTTWRHPVLRWQSPILPAAASSSPVPGMSGHHLLRSASPLMLLSSTSSPPNLPQTRFHGPTFQSVSYQYCKLPHPFVFTPPPTRQNPNSETTPLASFFEPCTPTVFRARGK